MSITIYVIHRKKSNINKSLKEVIPNPMDDFEGSKTSLEEITVDIGEIARQLEFKMEPKDVNKLLQFQDKAFYR